MTCILYGAGKIGNIFISSEAYKLSVVGEVFFYDNNKSLPNVICGLNRIESLDNIATDSRVIITCNDVEGVREHCSSLGITDISVFDASEDRIISIKDYYLQKKVYRNYKAQLYDNNRRKKIEEAREKFKKTNNLFMCITEVAIMLSNLCNYAAIHTKCPASCAKTKEIMPAKIVYRLLDELAQNDFSGTICFHIYNEPMMDPRLFLFIQYAKRVMPFCMIKIYTNAYYLNDTMAAELEECGVDIIETTAYGNEEYKRLLDLNIGVAYGTFLGHLDDRLDYYSLPSKTNNVDDGLECNSFLTQVSIYSNGDIGTCCLDYKHPYGLGNVFENSLEECLSTETIVNFQLELLNGNRSRFPICMNCNWARGVI